MVTSLLDHRKVIIQPMKDGNGERTFELGLIGTMSCHSWYSSTKTKPSESPIPHLTCEKTMQQPTPGLSSTQWLEDLFHSKQKPIPFFILPFKLSEMTLTLFVETSQHIEPPLHTPTPPIPGLSKYPASQEPLTENDSTHESEPEVALTQ
ncbi:hypothetical protein O181_033017 [Austropuccinia psidii MF-1]|uniref:Uncharacterized protein n=1 Tax=Austropuccinia psidii MF-1 TaxID=1389203 RepID=A0A9Q3H6S2_9BASI|nr:hypothetical protein [Austropuccinia psidii MF-1]